MPATMTTRQHNKQTHTTQNKSTPKNRIHGDSVLEEPNSGYYGNTTTKWHLPPITSKKAALLLPVPTVLLAEHT